MSWVAGDQDVQPRTIGEYVALRWREFGRLAPLNRTTVASVGDVDYAYAHTRIEFLRHLSRTALVVDENGLFDPIDGGLFRANGGVLPPYVIADLGQEVLWLSFHRVSCLTTKDFGVHSSKAQV